MKFKKLDPNAVLPTKAHTNDLGFDLYALETTTISGLSNKLIKTGIAAQFPVTMDESGFFTQKIGGILKDRSSVASTQRLYVKAGVIDPGYTGEIKILLENPDGFTKTVTAGTKIAQMILVQVIESDIEEVEEFTFDPVRGDKGFGSSGR
jgi:dUTP pyrophosphatase